MKDYVVVTAMENEYKILSELLKKNHINCAIVKTGIGKVNAAIKLNSFLENYPRVNRVISIGCAGATIPTLRIGDIVIGNSYCYHDVYCGEPNANGQVQGMPAVFPSSFMWIDDLERYKLGAIATGDCFVNTRERVESILNFLPKSYNVCAVDMESAALAQVCYDKGIEFTSIRVISDNPLLPKHLEQYESFWGDAAKKSFGELCNILSI